MQRRNEISKPTDECLLTLYDAPVMTNCMVNASSRFTR